MKQAQRYADLALHHRDNGNTAEAIRAALRTIELAPNVAGSFINLALLYRDADDYDSSTKMLFRALAIEPENPDAHMLLAENLLSRGDFRAGWREYEWRNRLSVAPDMEFRSAQWNGMTLPAGGRLVVLADQGYGDTIQFARFLPALRPFCGELVFCCEAKLAVALAGGAALCTTIVTEWEQVPPHAAHVRLSSVPGLLGVDHQYLLADTAPYATTIDRLVAGWQGVLDAGLPAGPLRVGLAWSGRRSHPDDRRRSIPLTKLTPLIDREHHELISLQNELREADFEERAIHEFGDHFILVMDGLTDFAETAAVIENLDLVISVDTAVAHLAGAMGKPTWLLLPAPCDWRWQRGRVDTPWYPSVRLFRQPTLGDWATPIAQVADALKEHFK